jgi:hypothetical protein
MKVFPVVGVVVVPPCSKTTEKVVAELVSKGFPIVEPTNAENCIESELPFRYWIVDIFVVRGLVVKRVVNVILTAEVFINI